MGFFIVDSIMPSIETLIAFTVAALVMNLSPGPSNFYVMARTLAQGVGGGLAAVLGLATGSLIHVCAAVLGLSALFLYSPTAYAILKLAGAAYLIYLGLGYLLRKIETEAPRPSTVVKPGMKIFRESVIVEATNPKTALFFIALLPQFINPDASPAPQFLLLGLIVSLSAIPCDLLVVYGTDRVRQFMGEHPRAMLMQNRVTGTILTALGAYILVDEAV